MRANFKDRIVVNRYAEAFLSFAKDGALRSQAIDDLKNLKALTNNNPDFLEFLRSLEITLSEKYSFIEAILGDEFLLETRQFLKLLLEKGRIDKITDIIEYVRVKYSRGGEVEALLRTSYLLDLDLIRSIEKKLEEKYSQKFKFYIDLDSSLLGGVQIIIGNTVIDGSVRRRLDELREKLMAVKV
ncbi:MAG: ATP synthase F1 subunit delta [Candidatus Omnitrophota bacterium]|jgi:F-type H+-transporting ATPase subunit delta